MGGEPVDRPDDLDPRSATILDDDRISLPDTRSRTFTLGGSPWGVASVGEQVGLGRGAGRPAVGCVWTPGAVTRVVRP